MALPADVHLHGVRILGRVSFVLIAVMASILNQADQDARAKGLISVHVEAFSMALGNHACMQPEPEELPEEVVPEKPPCPRSGK